MTDENLASERVALKPTEHTAGPWSKEGTRCYPNGDRFTIISAGTNSYGDGPESYVGYVKMEETDLWLTLAAPDLYEALRCFLEDERFQVAVGGNPNAVDAMLGRARAALAKASRGSHE